MSRMRLTTKLSRNKSNDEIYVKMMTSILGGMENDNFIIKKSYRREDH